VSQLRERGRQAPFLEALRDSAQREGAGKGIPTSTITP